MRTADLGITATKMPRSTPAEEGVDAAFREVFLEHYTSIRALAFKISSDPASAEDITQEAFLKLYEEWPRLRIKVSVKSWLARVLLNVAFSRYRKMSSTPAIPLLDEGARQESKESTPHEALEAAISREAVNLALSKIKLRDKEILLLRHSGFSYRDIAGALKVKETSVGKLVERAHHRFRIAYQQINPGEGDKA